MTIAPPLARIAVGVIVEAAHPGGIALVERSAAGLDRFIVETLAGPSPARIRTSAAAP